MFLGRSNEYTPLNPKIRENTNGSLVKYLSSRTTYSLQPADTHNELRHGDLLVELTDEARNLVPDSEFTTLPDLHDNTKASSPHDLTKFYRRGVGPLAVVQPRTHGGVQRNPCHLDQDLTRSDLQVTG